MSLADITVDRTFCPVACPNCNITGPPTAPTPVTSINWKETLDLSSFGTWNTEVDHRIFLARYQIR